MLFWLALVISLVQVFTVQTKGSLSTFFFTQKTSVEQKQLNFNHARSQEGYVKLFNRADEDLIFLLHWHFIELLQSFTLKLSFS